MKLVIARGTQYDSGAQDCLSCILEGEQFRGQSIDEIIIIPDLESMADELKAQLDPGADLILFVDTRDNFSREEIAAKFEGFKFLVKLGSGQTDDLDLIMAAIETELQPVVVNEVLAN